MSSKKVSIRIKKAHLLMIKVSERLAKCVVTKFNGIDDDGHNGNKLDLDA